MASWPSTAVYVVNRLQRFGQIACLILLTGACVNDQSEPAFDSHDPHHVALKLFQTSKLAEISDASLQQLFAPVPDLEKRAELYDAIEGLRVALNPEVVESEALPQLESFVVDLRATLVGGGEAYYSIYLGREGAEQPWIIRWFQGPGVEWPRGRSRRDSGLSNSTPPK